MMFLSGIFDFISQLFNSIMAMIKRILPYIMLAAAIYFGFGGVWAPTIFGSTLTISGAMGAALALGVSFLVAPDETVEVVTRVATAVGEAAAAVVEAAVPVVKAIANGLMDVLASSPLFWLVAGYFGYKFLIADDDKNSKPIASEGATQ